ncbi:MAG: hypothetical protein EA349_12115 [Halomonadaceae bacterium]|nr:MAG: hypothetical protein EA349_12115 [Halomonadaceae bacterium]
MSRLLEQGEVFFFYRSKVNQAEIAGLDDVQRFYLILVPDHQGLARLFVVGKKHLPDIIRDRPVAATREWVMNTLTERPDKVGEALRPIVYQTETRGEQHEGEAIPAGIGRYALFERKGSTRLGYRLTQPETPGPAQKALGILPESSLVISVRNPDVEVPGFPDDKPAYPQSLQDKFAHKRWINVDDPRLLNYEHAQLLLVGAHASLEQADIDLTGKPDLYQTLGVSHGEWQEEPMVEGEFAHPLCKAEPKAMEVPAPARVAQIFAGIGFPASGLELKEYARKRANEREMRVIKQFGDQPYKDMSDVAKELGRISAAQ